MDGRLTWTLCSWLAATMLLPHTTTLLASADCVNLEKKWTSAEVDEVFISCGLNVSGNFWWKGSNACDATGFGRLGINTQSCTDGSRNCALQQSTIMRELSTIVCCTENGPVKFEEAQQKECYQVSVCPTEAQLTVPSIIEADRMETAYIKVTTKPPPPLLSLLDIKIPGRESFNYTSSLAPPLESSDKAAEHVYSFRFQVPREMVVDPTTTVTFSPSLNLLPRGDSCNTLSVPSVPGIRVFASAAEVTKEPSTSSTPLTDGQSSEPCMAPPVTIGASIATFFVGLAAGLIPPLIIWLVMRQRRVKHYSTTSQRGLPEVPPAVSPLFLQSPRNPPTTMQFLQTNGHNGTVQNTPTPTDQSRLLAGQTPNNYPPPDNNPLNPSENQIPPYATTDQMRAIHLEARGHGYHPPMGSAGFGVLGDHELITEISSHNVSGGSPFRRSLSPGLETKSPLYAQEGNSINFISGNSPVHIAVV